MRLSLVRHLSILVSLALTLSVPTTWAQRDLGEDVSHFQAANGISQSSWNQMFTDGKLFVFIKASEGLTGPDDAAVANNVAGATAAGLRAGVYHYAHPENRPTPSGAVQEADHFLQYAANAIGPGYLRPALDLEANAGTLTATQLTDWVIAFAGEIVALRGPAAAPIIYCDQSFAANAFDSRIASYDLWLRAISATDPQIGNPATGLFTNWSFWQYSSSGSSGGISPLDLDVCHTEIKALDSFLITQMASPVKPSISVQPQSQSVTLGASPNFNVVPTLSSSTPLSYQWRFQGTNIPGATLTSYTRPIVQSSDAGDYTVVITNVAGGVTSSVATLTILVPLTLYQENFDSYLSPSVVTSPLTTNGFKVFYGAASNAIDFKAVFGFDYSTITYPTNIPSAPHSSGGTTKGLYLTVNKDASPAQAAVNLYPLSQSFTGNFSLKFDMWINWTNVATSTEHALFGINHSGNVTNRVAQATSDGLFFAVDGDGGASATSPSLRDFSVFTGGGNGVSPTLKLSNFGPAALLGSQFDNANPGFSTLFPAKTFGFTTPAGSAGLGWVSGEVRQETNLITWLLNDTIIAQYTNTTVYTNGNIMIGYNDNFASIGDTNDFVIFDNIRVETLNPDLDGDGLPDAWEIQYFGHTGVDPNDDADGDGMSNLREYLSGTNPTNSTSVFRILSAVKTNSDSLITWTTVGGHDYAVQFVTNNTGSLTTNFVDLSPVISVGGTAEGTTNYLHAGGGTNPAAYYRVRLVP